MPELSETDLGIGGSGVAAANKALKSDGAGNSDWGDIKGTEIDSESATSGHVLSADGAGGTTWEASAGGGGTVTSVAVSGSDGVEVDSGSPITGAGTIALGLNKTTTLSTLNVEDGADVTDATNVDSAGAVMESDFTTAFSLLVQQSGTGSPESLTVGTDTILGRVTGGGSEIDDLTPTQVRSLLNVEDGATADQTDAEVETAYNNQVGQVSAGEITAGTETAVRRFSPADVKSVVDTHGGGGGGGSTDPLYILAQGQSNINPRGTATETTTNSNVYVWNDNTTDAWEVWDLAAATAQVNHGEAGGASWAFYFACRLQEATGREVRVVMNTKSGAQIDEWIDGAAMWEELTNGTNGILENAGLSAGSFSVRLWGQGEADAAEVTSAYKTKYETVLTQCDALTETLVNFPTIVMPLAETEGTQDTMNAFLYSLRGDVTGRNYLMEGVQYLATEADGYHYDEASHIAMGRHFAWAAYNAAKPQQTTINQLKAVALPQYRADLNDSIKYGDAAATATYSQGQVKVSSSATANTSARFGLTGQYGLLLPNAGNSLGKGDWTRGGALTFNHRHGAGTTNGEYYVLIHDKSYNSSAIGTATGDAVLGFKCANNTMTGVSGNGTDAVDEAVGASQALNGNEANASLDTYAIYWDGKGRAEFYRNGLLFGITEDAPVEDNNRGLTLSLCIDNGADAAEQSFYIASITLTDAAAVNV